MIRSDSLALATRLRLGLDRIGLKLTAAFRHHGVQRAGRLELLVDDRFVYERPQPFSRLQFRRKGWQEHQTDAVRDTKIRGSVNACVVENQDNAALAFDAGLAGERRQHRFEHRLADAIEQVPDCLAAGRLNDGDDVEPEKAMVPERNRTLADRRPDAATDRLQTDAMLVGGPDFNRAARGCRGDFLDRGRKFFLHLLVLRRRRGGMQGRGIWIDQRMRFSTSQPRCG